MPVSDGYCTRMTRHYETSKRFYGLRFSLVKNCEHKDGDIKKKPNQMKTVSAKFVRLLLDHKCASGNRRKNHLIYAKMRTAASNIVYPSTKFIDYGGLAKICLSMEKKNVFCV